MTLPFWSDNPHCRAILAAILAERPDCWMLRRFAWVDARYPKFKGDNAACLRRYWEVQCDGALRLNDGALFERLHEEIPDDLIQRLLTAPAMDLAA